MTNITEVSTGSEVILIKVLDNKKECLELIKMGLIPGEKIKIITNSGEDKLTISIKGFTLALSHDIAESLIVKKITKKISVALAGNPNCGKSNIFNNITGAKQHVGNYPGVTVESKKGNAKFNDYELEIVDLPGIYSLSCQSSDEIVTRDFILNEKPDIIIQVVDSSNLERNLYLYTQISELNIPIIIAMNMTDIIMANGYEIKYNVLSKLLGRPIVKTSGSKNEGMSNLCQAVIDLYESNVKAKEKFLDYGEDIQREFTNIAKVLKDSQNELSNYSQQWLVIKLIEQDPYVLEIINKLPNKNIILEQVEKSTNHLKHHFGDDIDIFIAERRYGFISGVIKQTVKESIQERINYSEAIDKIILNKFLGVPIFALVMYLIFKFTFTFSQPVVDYLGAMFEWLAGVMTFHITKGLIQSLVVDGIIGGVGGVLSFYPLVLFMFFAIAFFEDTGYMARAAFVMDRIMHKFGLHGKSFLPLMVSTNGCAVPGIMATRTLESKKDRIITMLVAPFMICGAKLPIFALFISAFFPAKLGTNIMFLMYSLSIIIALVSAYILKKFIFKGEAAHFVMELPPYRLPTLKGLLLKMWERGWMYVKKAGSIILMISIVIWFGFTFPRIDAPEDVSDKRIASMQIEQSYAGKLGKFIEPAIAPIGMDWRAGVAIIAGLAAKEVVVSTFGTIYSLGNVDLNDPTSLDESLRDDPNWSPLKALAFLIFSLIYAPCLAATTTFFRESGSSLKLTIFLVGWTTSMAWIFAYAVFQIGRAMGF